MTGSFLTPPGPAPPMAPEPPLQDQLAPASIWIRYGLPPVIRQIRSAASGATGTSAVSEQSPQE